MAAPGMVAKTKRDGIRRLARWSLGGVLLVVGTIATTSVYMISCMPGRSHEGTLPALTTDEAALAEELRRDVKTLAVEIGPREVHIPAKLNAAADWIEAEFESEGYEVERQTYNVMNVACHNLIAEIPGKTAPDEILVIGAHYDSVHDCPAANDNGSAVASMLALARRFANCRTGRTLRFVAFTNEEPPYFQTERMGSYVYARRCHERGEKVVGMMSLETMGYYSDEPGSQHYPAPFSLLYPSTGNFIAFIGNLDSRGFIRDSVGAFRRHTRFPSEGAALPSFIEAAGWSDQWSFWEFGYPALMVTDTAPFRYPYYHTPEDTPDKLDFERLARVTAGLESALAELARAAR